MSGPGQQAGTVCESILATGKGGEIVPTLEKVECSLS